LGFGFRVSSVDCHPDSGWADVRHASRESPAPIEHCQKTIIILPKNDNLRKFLSEIMIYGLWFMESFSKSFVGNHGLWLMEPGQP